MALRTSQVSRSVPELLVRRLLGVNDTSVLTTFGTSHAAVGVGKILFPFFALALELPETYFDDKV